MFFDLSNGFENPISRKSRENKLADEGCGTSRSYPFWHSKLWPFFKTKFCKPRVPKVWVSDVWRHCPHCLGCSPSPVPPTCRLPMKLRTLRTEADCSPRISIWRIYSYQLHPVCSFDLGIFLKSRTIWRQRSEKHFTPWPSSSSSYMAKSSDWQKHIAHSSGSISIETNISECFTRTSEVDCLSFFALHLALVPSWARTCGVQEPP